MGGYPSALVVLPGLAEAEHAVARFAYLWTLVVCLWRPVATGKLPLAYQSVSAVLLSEPGELLPIPPSVGVHHAGGLQRDRPAHLHGALPHRYPGVLFPGVFLSTRLILEDVIPCAPLALLVLSVAQWCLPTPLRAQLLPSS